VSDRDRHKDGGGAAGMVTRMPKKRRRYSRRRGLVGAAARRRRLLVVGLAAVIVVGGFFTIVGFQVGPAERIYQRNIDTSFATLVTPIARESNGTGLELTSILGGGDSSLGKKNLVATLASMVGDADSAVSEFKVLTPPANLDGAADSCLSALQGRASAMAAFESAVATLLQGPTADAGHDGTSQAETSIEHLASALTITDDSWSSCRNALLRAPGQEANSVPASAWTGFDASVWQQASVTGFITALAESAPHVAVPPLAIVTVSGNPPAVVTSGSADVLPTTDGYSLHVVVADVGDKAEHDVVVTVALKPIGSKGSAESRSADGSILAGQSASFHPPTLPVTPGATYTLSVQVTGPGQTAPATRIYKIIVASESGVPTS
jgi:hypothetical protein